MNGTLKHKNKNPFLETGMQSIQGTREYQQDYYFYYEDHDEAIGIVCDGMGGLSGGEKASYTAASLLGNAFIDRNRELPLSHFLLYLAQQMNEQVVSICDEEGNPLHAGTTAVAAVVTGEVLTFLSVGDSRIYLLRGERLVQLTRDHNYRMTLKQALDEGKISEADYEKEEKMPRAEALISYIGIPRLTLSDVNSEPILLKDGDIILLCSDGLYKSLNDAQIRALIRDNDIDMSIAADRLCTMALKRRPAGQDNTTVILMAYRQAGGEDTMDE